MGRRKISVTELIQNSNKRCVTYAKRKRGLIKKAIELSVMCDQHVAITIFSKDN